MSFLYSLSIFFYQLAIKIAAWGGNSKAQLWVNGRKGILGKIEKSLNQKPIPTNNKTVWIHVSSLGEFEQGRPVIEALKQQIDPHFSIVLTFFSPSGYEIRKNYTFADHIFYLPIDTPTNAHTFLNLVKPDLAIFVKYDFWRHYLTELERQNIPTLLISAVFREKQFAPTNLYAPILKAMLGKFTKILVQDPPSVKLLNKQGFTNVERTGDTRVDRVLDIATQTDLGQLSDKKWEIVKNFVGNSQIFIGGSTWEADEKLILHLLQNPKFDDWKFIFAPHDIQVSNIKRLTSSLPLPYVLHSEQMNLTNIPSNYSERILVVDCVGMLSVLYHFGQIAYIGGGFGKGIHNTLEPIAFGLPVIFGQKYQKFNEAVALVEMGGGFSVSDGDSFQNTMKKLLEEEFHTKASAAASDYIQQNRGATLLVIQEVMNFV
jgi:3-deoxy-D-manno-octulosonic-acid transferase